MVTEVLVDFSTISMKNLQKIHNYKEIEIEKSNNNRNNRTRWSIFNRVTFRKMI